MSAAEAFVPEISEPLTWREICDRHPDEWVCLAEIDFVHPNGFELRTARVIGHGTTRQAPLDQAEPWREQYAEIGYFYTGLIAAHTFWPRPFRVELIDD